MWVGHRPLYRSSFYEMIQYKDYRKELRLENTIINDRMHRKARSYLQNVTNIAKNNYKRIRLFGVFVLIFSLEFLYDYYLPNRYQLQRLKSKAKELVFGTARVYCKTIAEVDKQMVNRMDDTEKEIARQYLLIDKTLPQGIQSVSQQLFSTLSIPAPSPLNISSFFSAIRQSPTPRQQVLDNIRLFSTNQRAVLVS